MREIKVRAWWKDTMEPIPDFMEEYCIEVLDSHPDNPFIWDLYTGLKDKNGVEICESDVVKYEGVHNPRFYEVEAVIEHDDDNAQLRPRDISENSRGGRYYESWAFCRNIQVIGNIHETPDLLDLPKEAEEAV